MAHGENAAKKGHVGTAADYDSGRGGLSGPPPGRFTKRVTHRRERRAARMAVLEALLDTGLTPINGAGE